MSKGIPENDHTAHRSHNLVRALYLIGTGLVLLTFLTPLVAAPKLFIFPFVTTKVWFLRSTIVLAAACLIPVLLVDKTFRYKLSIVHYAIIAYIGVLLVNVAVSIDPHFSWYSGQERMLGVFTTLHAAGLAFLLPIVARGWNRTRIHGKMVLGWKDIWAYIITIAVATGMVGIVQFFSSGVYFNPGGGRIDASLGNPIYLGHLAAVTAVASVMMTLQTARKKSRIAWLGAGIFLLLIVLMTGSRSAVLGVYAATIVGLVVALKSSGLRTYKKKITWILFGVVLLPILIFATPLRSVFSVTSATSRLVSITQDMTPRLHAWRIALKAFKARPLLGWGQGNFYVPFNLYLETTVLGNSSYETWFDEAHNIVLNTLATTGALGVATWLWLYGSAFLKGARVIRTQPDRTILMIGGVAMLVADGGSKFFAFDNAVSLIVVFTVLGFMSAHMGESDGTEVKTLSVSRTAVLSAVAWVCAIAFVFETNIKPAIANHQTLKTFQLAQAHPKQLVVGIEELMSYDSPHKTDMTHDVAKLIVAGSGWLRQQLTPQEFEHLVRVTLSYHSRTIDEYPHELLRTITELRLARLLLPDKDIEEHIDARFKKMVSLSPNRQQLYYEYADIKLALADIDGALMLLDQAERIRDDVGTTFFKRSELYVAENRWDEAFKQWEHAVHDLGFGPQSASELYHSVLVIDRARAPIIRWTEELMNLYAQSSGAVPDEVMVLMVRTYTHAGLLKRAHELAQVAVARYPHTRSELQSELEEPERDTDAEPLYAYVRERVDARKNVYTFEFSQLMWLLGQAQQIERAREILEAYMDSGHATEPSSYYECVLSESQNIKTAQMPKELCL